ncbi:MAG: aminoacyl-tRNA hydrolase [Kiloniellaceae bacterium]
MPGVTFIGITGSAGKTSTKEMVAAILEAAGSVKHSFGTANRIYHIAEIITATKATDDYCVLELSAERPDYFDPLLELVRPMIGVVTKVGEDQLKAFGSKEAIAAEKGKLITSLPPEGTAVLNADDPLVLAMGEGFKGRVITFGLNDGADLQARELRSDWPQRLSFTVTYRGEDHPVQTQLCGKHWVTSTLAALATGVAAGIPLAEAAKAVAQVAPGRARMQPVTTPDGVTFVRDDWKASFWGMSAVFDFLKDAKAERKIVVFGTLADYQGSVGPKYQTLGQEALKVADVVIFAGSMATYGLSAQKFASKDQVLMAFPDVRQASVELGKILRAGDLVLLKGSGPADHLGRLYHARTGPVACWRMDCGKDMLCDACPLLRPKNGEAAQATASAKTQGDLDQDFIEATRSREPLQVLVGIGNPGEKYRNTPHNVGFSVLDILAERHGLAWEKVEDAQLAQLDLRGTRTLLVKPQKYVNNTGKALLALSRSMGFSCSDVVLVQDDINLPLGTIRTRMRGSDGGHLGIRSTLVAFQTSDIPRVKVGVNLSTNRLSPADYLVSPFSPAASGKVKAACVVAADRLLELVANRNCGG